MRDAVTSRTPVLGLCLGAQLLASAVGGTAFRAPVPEVGVVPVALQPAAAADPVLAPVAHLFSHPASATASAAAAGPGVGAFRSHHGDTFTLPDTALVLGTSAMYTQVRVRGRVVCAVAFIAAQALPHGWPRGRVLQLVAACACALSRARAWVRARRPLL
jgi:GMP synthase-like glutamine amidotransferase